MSDGSEGTGTVRIESHTLPGHLAALSLAQPEEVVVASEDGRPKAAIELWARKHPEVERLRQLLKDIQSTPEVDLAMLAVAERELRRLAERT
jgi:NAD-specific glutamate dehydrogenase